jgi:hypothetical protein
METLKIPRSKHIVAFLFFCVLCSNTTYTQITLTTLGNNSVNIPAGSTYALIQCLGAGGAGGGASGTAATTIGYAGGGGGGAYSEVMIPVIPGETMNAFVGAGGASAGLNPFDGAPGQASYVSYNGTTVCKANGGLGGQGVTQTNGVGGTGGNSGIGFLYAGGRGGNGSIATNRGGGGGGAAGSTGAGGSGGAPAGGTAGTGGFGSGTGGGGASSWTGAAGTIYGAGGGGGGTGTNNSNGAGGAGSQGKIVITFCSDSFTTQPSTTPQSVCIGGTATTLTAISTSGGPYLWYSNTTPSNVGGVSTGITTSTFNPPTGVAGTRYYYCVAGAGACAIPSNVSGPISVGGAISVTGSTLLCGSGSVTLNATSPGATGYLWSPGGQTTSSITVSPSATTNYSVTTTGGLCPGTSNQTITVSPPITFSATVTSENLNGYTNSAGDILYLNAYPIQNNIMINGLNNSYTGSLGGAWTASTVNAGSTCGGQNATLSFVTTNTYLGSGVTITPQEGTHMLRFNSGFTDAGGLGYVTSPSFSTVGYTGMIIDFWFLQFVNSNGGENVSVEYRIGAGAWTAMTSNILRAGTSTQCPSWMNFSQEFPAAMMGQAAVQVRFRFYSGGCAGQQMLLDNIRISGVTAPGGYGYYSNYLWTSAANGVSATIVNPFIRSTTTADINKANTAGSILFNVQLTDGAGCVYNASDVVNINTGVSGSVVATATASPQIICSTPGTTNLSTATGTGPGTIQWEQSTVGPSGPWTDVPGATTIDFTATGITQTTWYRIKPVTGFAAWSGSCSSNALTTNPVMVTIGSLIPGIIQNTGETVACGGDPGQFSFSTMPSSSGTGFTYQWYSYNGSTTAPVGSTIPGGWTAVGSPGSVTQTTNTQGLNSLPAGWAQTSVTFSATCFGAASNSATFNAAADVLTTETYASPVTSLSFVYIARHSVTTAASANMLVEAWNGASWVTIANLTKNTSSTSCISSNHSYNFLFSDNYRRFRFTRTTAPGIANLFIDDVVAVTSSADPFYNPPANPTNTLTYACYVSVSSPCPISGWASQQWVVTASASGTSTDWTGAALDWNWFNPANWSCGIPVCGIDANIPVVGNATYPRIDDALGMGASCRTITIASGASLTTIGTANLDVCGNWVKDGTYTHNSGKISMVGTTAQTMSPASTFYNLTINNTGPGVTISADQTVNNILTLIDGVVTTDANHVIISNESPGNVVNGGANPTNYTNSWINGNIRRAFTTNTGIYDFPVGCGTYAALARLTNGNIGGVTSIDAWYKEPLTSYSPLDATKAIDFGTPYDACYPDGYWYLEPETSSISSGNYILQLYFNGFTSITAADDNKFGIVKRPSTSVSSMDWSTQIPTDGAGFLAPNGGAGRLFSDGFAQRSNLTMFSHFAIAYAANPLPIELTSFTGSCAGRTKTFNWTTASETNNDFFTLERSTDGETFETVKIIPGAGTSTSSQHYSVQIAEADANLVYYRLKQTDYDGQYSYSNIIHVSCTSDNGYADELTVYPNPANESIQIQLHSNEQGTYVIAIYNLLGQVVQEVQQTKSGAETLSIPLSVANGQYVVRVTELNSGKTFNPVKIQVITK